jgi:hypothetical protein
LGIQHKENSMSNVDKNPRLPFWFPESATKAAKNETSPRLVSYLSPSGKTRRYVASEREAKFYASLFRGTRRSGTE